MTRIPNAWTGYSSHGMELPQRPSPTSVRLDPELRSFVAAEAQAQGVTPSEYIRQALHVRLAWSQAVRAMQAGADADVLLDPHRFASKLARLAD